MEKPRLPYGGCCSGGSDLGGAQTWGPEQERNDVSLEKGAMLKSLHGHGGAPTRSERGGRPLSWGKKRVHAPHEPPG